MNLKKYKVNKVYSPTNLDIVKEKTNKENREVAGSWGLDWDDASFDFDAPKLAEIHSKQNENFRHNKISAH